MNKWSSILKLALASSFLAASASAYAAYDSGSTGADLAFNPTASQSIQLPPDGKFNYTTVNIPVNVKITYIKNAANTPVTILASGNVVIDGTIDVSAVTTDMATGGAGGPGGYDGGNAGSALAIASWVTGYTGLNVGRAGSGPGAGAPGSVNKAISNPGTGYMLPNINAGGGGAYGAAPPPAAGLCLTTPGVIYGNAILLPLIGGSGGGGGAGGTLSSGSGGGGGGGAILIASSTSINIATTGSILANGGVPFSPGSNLTSSGRGEYGGGGSGGAIHLIAPVVTGNGVVSAVGGLVPAGSYVIGSYSYNVCNSYANGSMNGGDGRIRVDADSLIRTTGTNPTWTKGTTASVSQLTTIPTLSISSIGGVAVPAGNSTVALPPTFVNPVTVTFETSNVIVGSAIKLTVTPPLGLAYSVTSGATTGTSASATASATVTLQGGSNTLQATVTYAVVVAAGEALSTYALGERVEKVTLASTLGSKETKVTLTTISGKEFVVPASVLAGIPS